MSLCEDLSEFLESLQKMRLVDDRIVYTLNTTIPTPSFANKVDAPATCKDLFAQLVKTHTDRDSGIQKCIDYSKVKVEKLKEEKKADPDNQKIIKALKREQMKLRELQLQVNVEEVIRARSLKIYNEKCRVYYKPPQ